MKIRLSVASRLFLGFSAVSIGVLVITLVSVITMQDIQKSIELIVDEVSPTENTLADLQNESLNLSRLVSVYFNEKDLEVVSVVKNDFEESKAKYSQIEADLLKLIGQFPELTNSTKKLQSMSTEVNVLLDTISENMTAYQSSLLSLKEISAKRSEIIAVNEELTLVSTDFILDTSDPKAQKMAYDTRSLVEKGGSLALQLTFSGDLVSFEESKKLFRDFNDDYNKIGFKMLRYARNDDVFKTNMQKVASVVTSLVGLVSLEGGVIPVQNQYLQLRASLNQKLAEIQVDLTSNVNTLNDISVDVGHQSKLASEAAYQKGSNARTTLTIAAAIVILTSTLISYFVVQSIKVPLRRLRAFIQKVGQGDLTSTIGKYSADELGDISRAADQLVTELRTMVLEIEKQSSMVNQVANQTNELAELTQVKSTEQQQGVDHSVHSIGEMSGSIKEVAQTAEMNSQEMQSSEVEAENINQGISGTVDSIAELNLRMQKAVDVIQALDQGVVSIESILETIQTIAEQTNLLALNAAIEAARAGEQGRGFAVVADEVRTLATRTQSSTEEIRAKIDGIQKQSNQAVSTISDSQKSTATVAESAQEAGDKFKDFMVQIRNLSSANVSIAAAAEEQSATTEEMSRVMNEIGELTKETTSITGEVASSIRSLNSVATDLDDAVHRFKT